MSVTGPWHILSYVELHFTFHFAQIHDRGAFHQLYIIIYKYILLAHFTYIYFLIKCSIGFIIEMVRVVESIQMNKRN